MQCYEVNLAFATMGAAEPGSHLDTCFLPPHIYQSLSPGDTESTNVDKSHTCPRFSTSSATLVQAITVVHLEDFERLLLAFLLSPIPIHSFPSSHMNLWKRILTTSFLYLMPTSPHFLLLLS